MIATQIQTHLRDIGEYGRPCGMRPWVVADVVEYLSDKPEQSAVFWLRAQGYSWYTVAMAMSVSISALGMIRRQMKCMMSLLETGVVA